MDKGDLLKKISDLQEANYRAQGYSGNQLDQIMNLQRSLDEKTREVESLRNSFSTIISVWKQQLNDINVKYPQDNWKIDQSVIDKLLSHNI